MLNISKNRSSSRLQRATLMIAAICATGVGVGSASVLLSQPAYAAADIDVRTRIVRYRDLDLGSQQGRDLLNQRIRRAAKRVCAVDGMPSILFRRQIRACEEAAHSRAWASAQDKVRNYRLAVSNTN